MIGNAGGGKSTLARKLAARHGLRLQRASEIVFIGMPLWMPEIRRLVEAVEAVGTRVRRIAERRGAGSVFGGE